MPKQILYGVGNSILREFANEKNIVALSKLKNLSVEASGSEDKIFGGDSAFPIASFPKDKAIKISAENATFSLNFLNVSQGASLATGAITYDEVQTLIIPTDGIVKLKYEVIADSVVVDGFTVSETAPTAGQYKEDTVLKTNVTFAVADAGKEVDIVYQRTSGATTSTLSILKDSMAKPFKFIHRIPVYDDNNSIVGQAQLVVYKAKSTNAFTFGLQPQQAFAPKLELEALDPKRPDGKLWDFSLDLTVVA